MLIRRGGGTASAAALVAIAAAITLATPRPFVTSMTRSLAATSPQASAISSPNAGSHPLAAAVKTTPSRLVIASIGLDAAIEPRGLDSKRNLDTAASPNDVAWYDLGPAPGQPGNAIINGHVDWWTGDAVFTRLGRVRPGDVVQVVRADGRVMTFRITLLQRVGASARIPSLFTTSGPATLTLITCAGVWNPLALTNTDRLLVSATLV